MEPGFTDFPPTPSYVLDADAANGPRAMPGPVVYHRTTYRSWRNAQVAVPTADRRATLVCWLGRLGGKATHVACERTWVHDIGWSNTASLRRLVTKDQDAIAHDFAAMVRELTMSRALLRDDAKTAKPDVRVVLNDARGDRSQPLPEPASLLAAPKPPPRVALR